LKAIKRNPFAILRFCKPYNTNYLEHAYIGYLLASLPGKHLRSTHRAHHLNKRNIEQSSQTIDLS